MIRTAVWFTVLCSFFALASPQSTAPTYENLNAVLWMQTSVEYKASATQTYRTAKRALLRGIHDPHWTAALEQTGDFQDLPPAVILDLDETVLDNSVFEARLVASGAPYSLRAWRNWVDERSAGLVPGARDFLQFAHANGVAPLYITNRACDPSKDSDPTVQLLRNLHLPLDPVGERLFCDDGKNGDKTERRKKCVARFRILLLFGDQLSDFLQIPPESASLEGREKLFEAHQGLWGERWFQLPNPMYGSGHDSWEGVVGFGVAEKLRHLRM
jgi:acid phosphatase